MDEFWESSFKEKKTMWGFEPADSALVALDIFRKNGIKKILIPGYGYGRNAKVFLDNGFDVTGIEISETAIALAKKHFGGGMKIYHGSVNAMPFDCELYGGIYSYALIHLLNSRERARLIKNCYNQLQPGGYMVFTTISKDYPMYGRGKEISTDRFQTLPGIKMYFYDPDSIRKEFGKYGLTDCREIDEPVKNMSNKPPVKFWLIVCRKQPEN